MEQSDFQPQDTPYQPYLPTNAEPPVVPAQPPRRTADRRDFTFALLLAVLSVLCADSYLWGGAGLAAGICTIALFAVSAGYLLQKRKALTFYGCFCAAAYLACAASLFLTDSIKLFTIAAMFLLSTVAMLELMQLRSSRDGGYRCIGDVCYALFALTFGKLSGTCRALFRGQADGGAPRGRRVGGILLGLLISVPVLLVLIPLLMSSDAAFSSIVRRLNTQSFSEISSAVLIGAAVFLLVFSRLFSLPEASRKAAAAPSAQGVSIGILLSFLSAISAVYLLYLLSQLAYFFNAFSGLLPKSFTVAEYARRGFFEMTLICIINLVIIFIINLISPKKGGSAVLSVRLFSLFLCVFSLLLAATSASKIFLYINRFGMTRLRVCTLVFIVFLTVLLFAVILRLFRKKVPYMKIAVFTATLLFLGSVFGNVDRVIAAYNVGSYQSGRLSSIDMDTLADLHSSTAVPYLLELTDDASPEVAQRARELLTFRADTLFNITVTERTAQITGNRGDWRAWNLTTSQARQLLREHFTAYYQIEIPQQ